MPNTSQLLEELIAFQKERLLEIAQRIVPHVVQDDLLQPNDFKELEEHPTFRYEEGILHGLQAAQAAFLSRKAHV